MNFSIYFTLNEIHDLHRLFLNSLNENNQYFNEAASYADEFDSLLNMDDDGTGVPVPYQDRPNYEGIVKNIVNQRVFEPGGRVEDIIQNTLSQMLMCMKSGKYLGFSKGMPTTGDCSATLDALSHIRNQPVYERVAWFKTTAQNAARRQSAIASSQKRPISLVAGNTGKFLQRAAKSPVMDISDVEKMATAERGEEDIGRSPSFRSIEKSSETPESVSLSQLQKAILHDMETNEFKTTSGDPIGKNIIEKAIMIYKDFFQSNEYLASLKEEEPLKLTQDTIFKKYQNDSRIGEISLAGAARILNVIRQATQNALKKMGEDSGISFRYNPIKAKGSGRKKKAQE